MRNDQFKMENEEVIEVVANSEEQNLDFGGTTSFLLSEKYMNLYLDYILTRLGKTLINSARMRDGSIVDFFSHVLTPKMCKDLLKVLDKIEKLFPEEFGKPVFTKDVNESSKILVSSSPLTIINELEKQSGVSLNKEGVSSDAPFRTLINKPPFVKKVEKPRNKLTKKKSLFCKANDTMKQKRDNKGRFVKE